MNYLAHGLPFLDSPTVLAGSAVPDMLSAVDRKCRLRLRHVESRLNDEDPFLASVAKGVHAHLVDDHRFHATAAFVETSSKLARQFRAVLPDDESHRVGFLGHILLELLLDRWLIEHVPGLLEDWHNALADVNPAALQHAVNSMAGRPTEKLAKMVPRLLEERFLDDYPDDAGLLYRVNGVMKRVGLPKLPDSFAGELSPAYAAVTARASELLPARVLNCVPAQGELNSRPDPTNS